MIEQEDVAVVFGGLDSPVSLAMRSLTRIQWDVPIISHWGISGVRFPELAGEIANKVEFVQTYSF